MYWCSEWLVVHTTVTARMLDPLPQFKPKIMCTAHGPWDHCNITQLELFYSLSLLLQMIMGLPSRKRIVLTGTPIQVHANAAHSLRDMWLWLIEINTERPSRVLFTGWILQSWNPRYHHIAVNWDFFATVALWCSQVHTLHSRRYMRSLLFSLGSPMPPRRRRTRAKEGQKRSAVKIIPASSDLCTFLVFKQRHVYKCVG